MSVGKYPVDPIAKLQSPGFSQEMSSAQATSVEFVLYRAVVTAVINDVALRTEEEMDILRARLNITEYAQLLDDPELTDVFKASDKQEYLLMNAPRNSLLVRVINDGWDKKNDRQLLCYPFFPPHLGFPIKAGEQVWIINEVPGKLFEPAHWMCRIPEPLPFDGINFTHADRKFAPARDKASLADKAEAQEGGTSPEDEKDYIPGFNNGGGFPAGPLTLKQPGSPEVSEYDVIYTGSVANKSFTMEPVPRFTKRPGDLVLQGSNNTLIALGEDRGYTSEVAAPSLVDATKSNASATDEEANERSFAGTIDVVVGRGRFLPAAPEDPPELTAPRIVKNTREKIETEKNPTKRLPEDADVIKAREDRRYNPAEGDPDFINDSSRVYVSMKTSGDKNLGLEYPQMPPPGSSNTGADVAPVDEKPYIILKSDEIRIVARKDDANDINGSIKIIKEGEGDKDRAVIIMNADGSIMIDGSKIVIGSGMEKGNGAGEQVAVGLGATEPMVLGQVLLDMMDEFCTTLTTAIGNYGLPLTDINAAAGKLQGKLQTFLSKNAKLK